MTLKNSEFPVLVVGLPASGKTTFLAALWHVVSNSGQSRFAVHSFVGDREYVNQLEKTWLSATQLPRTPRQTATLVRMSVEDRSSGATYSLSFPDLSGEDYLSFYATREWPPVVSELVLEAAGVLIFVNPDNVVRPTTLADVDAAAAAAGARNVPETSIDDGKPAPWDPEKSPTAVVLVDLLRSMSESRRVRGAPLRIALLVSAWDTMRDYGMTPEEWVRRDLSLLHQYLLTNSEHYDCRVYGVSAQGGDVTDPAEQARLLALANATMRVQVTGDNEHHNDLSIPILWLAD